ncbi:O-antigen ligase family protein [Acuticoccus sediminis]|uniref:O-antigen ligase family protein n=1 Tax=Acuticoccus sediminis TaxID=2184697 RepID=UPI001CFD078D|nr:O-antigen ligase family protein [Acuticoccus sediminis]
MHASRIASYGVMGVIGWTALAVALASAVPLGANRPVSWIGLSLATYALFAAALALDVHRPSSRAARLWPSALLAALAIGWGFVQTSPMLSALAQWFAARAAGTLGIVAPSLMHPVWSTVDAPGAISADPIDGHHAVLRLTTYVALFWIALQAGRDRGRARAMLAAAAIGVSVLCAYGLLAAALGRNPLLGPDAKALSATFVNRNSFATYAAFGVIMNLALTLAGFRHRARRSRAMRDVARAVVGRGWVHVVGFAVCAAALLGSQSRGGALAALVGSAAVVTLARRGGRGGGLRRPGVVLPALVAAFVLCVGASGVLGRFLADPSAENLRTPVYLATLDAIADRPILGHGLGAYQDVFRAYVPMGAGAAEWDKAHNTYLELAFELGVPAACALLLAIALLAARVARGALAGGRNAAVMYAAAGCTLAAAVHSLVDFSLQIPAVAALFAVVLGLGTAAATAGTVPRRVRSWGAAGSQHHPLSAGVRYAGRRPPGWTG